MRYKRLRVSRYIDINSKGVYPNRFVLLLIEGENRAHPYSTHLEVNPYDGANNGKPFIVHGDYCTTIEEAEISFKERMNRKLTSENKEFKPDEEYIGD